MDSTVAATSQATITASELDRRLSAGERIRIIDVRSPGEYAAGHIPGAMSVPMDEAESRIADLGTGEPVAVVCQSGQRAAVTCNLLKGKHPNLLLVEGGTDAWVNNGLAVVRSTVSRWSIERQVRLVAGLLVLTGVILSFTVNPAWIWLSAFIGAGLTFAGATNICGMAALFATMPWNKARS